MDGSVPDGFIRVPREQFESFLAVVNWQRDGWGNGEAYKRVADRKTVGWHRDSDDSYWLAPEYA